MGGYIGRGQPVAAGNDSVESADIVDDAVTNAKIATNAVTGDSIAANAVGNSELSDNAVDTAEIAADAVDGTKIADNAIGNEHIEDDAVGVAELSATGTASSSTFLRGDNSWQTAGSTSASDLTSGTLPIARIADDAITADKLANSINTDIATGPAALPKAGGTVTGTLYATHTGGIEVNSTSHAYLRVNSSATNKASWVNFKQGGTSRWLAGVEGSETKWQLYSNDASATKFSVTTAGAVTATSFTGDGSALTGVASAGRYFYARGADTSTILTASDSTHTKISALGSVKQSHSAFSDANDKWTATADDAGDWMFFGQVGFYNSGNSMDNPIGSIAVNGSRVSGGYNWVYSGSGGDGVRHFVTTTQCVITIAQNDYVELYGYAEFSSGTLYIFGGDSQGYKQTSILGVKL